MLFARSDIGDKDEIEGDPEDFESFYHSENIDLAKYPPNYDPFDPDQEEIKSIIVKVSLFVQPTSQGEGKSFNHISPKEAVKIIKKVVQGLKD